MKLTDADLREFQEAWKADFDQEISVDQARHEASLLLEYYRAIAATLRRMQSPERRESANEQL